MDIPFNVKEVCRLLETARFAEKKRLSFGTQRVSNKTLFDWEMNDEVPLVGRFLTCIVTLKVWLLVNIFFAKNIHLAFEIHIDEVHYGNVET